MKRPTLRITTHRDKVTVRVDAKDGRVFTMNLDAHEFFERVIQSEELFNHQKGEVEMEGIEC